MTRTEYIARRRLALEGMIFQALHAGREKSAGELALWVRMIQDNVERELGEGYDELTAPPLGANGAARGGQHAPPGVQEQRPTASGTQKRV